MRRTSLTAGPRPWGAVVAAACLLALPLSAPCAAREGAPAGSEAGVGIGNASFRDFNDTLYTLAYDVFLAARNVKAAYMLATEAVRQRPGLIAWRERLARAAEWSGNPVLALQEWEHIYAQNPRPEAFREGIRLAGSLRNHDASVRAWEGLARIRELDAGEWELLLAEYESSGEPGRGIARLRTRLASRPDRDLAGKLVDVLQRTGRDADALKTLEELANRFGNSASIGLKRAQIYCRRGRIREAAAVLDGIRGLTAKAKGPEQAAIRRLEAATFTWLQRYGDAMQSYRAVFESADYDLDDLRGLCDLARDRDPDLALRAAVAGWGKFKYPDFLVYYLERCISAGRWDLASRALAKLAPEEWSLFAEIPYFFSLAARIHQHDGKESLARREHLHALSLEPASEDYQAGFLWLLMNQGRMADLETHAERWDRGRRNSRTLLEPLAMAYKLLHRHRQALEYFRRLDEGENRTDFPFLLGYADLLEQAGDGQGAARVYLRAQAVLRSPPAPGQERESREWREAQARWTWKFGGSDETGRHMDDLVASYAGGEGSKELMFSWRVARGENPEDAMAALRGVSDPARSRSGSGVEKGFPAWARLAVAMRTNDPGKVGDLLETNEATLSPDDKARAAAFLGLPMVAARYAIEGSGGAHSASGGAGRQGATGVGGHAEAASHPHYVEYRSEISGQTPLGARTLLRVSAETRRRPWISSLLSIAVPAREDVARLTLQRESGLGTTRLAVGIRSAGADHRGGAAGGESAVTASAEQEWRIMQEASLSFSYHRNAIAEENPVLALAGQKNQGRIGLSLALPAQIRMDLLAARSTFHDWDGRELGDGAIFKLAAEHSLLRYLALAGSLAYNSFSPADTRPGPAGNPLISGVLPLNEFPQSFWHGSGSLEWLRRPPESASWKVSPFASAEAGRNYFPSPGGPGVWGNDYALRAGLALFPTYSQQLLVMGVFSKGLQRRSGRETALSTQYEYSFK